MLRIPSIIALLLMSVSSAAMAQDNPADAVIAAASGKVQTPAQLRSAELDRLFGQLQAADGEAKAHTIEQKIWTNWARAESTTAELLLSQAGRAMAAEEYNAALAILDELLKAEPAFAEAWNRRATLYYKMRRYPQSLADIDKVLDLEPRHFGALAGRAMIFMELDKPDDALAAYREALTMNPHMTGVVDAVKKLEKERPDI